MLCIAPSKFKKIFLSGKTQNYKEYRSISALMDIRNMNVGERKIIAIIMLISNFASSYIATSLEKKWGEYIQ